MANIRLVTFYEAPKCWDITDANYDKDVIVQLSEYVFGHIDHIDSPGFEVEDFEIPDNLMMESNKELVVDLCKGRSFTIWYDVDVNFNNQYFNNWIFFKNKDNSWEEF